MGQATALVRDFFDAYARARSAQDIDVIASQYPDSFTYAGPRGARVAERAGTIAAFPKGREFLKSIGHQSTRVVSLEEGDIARPYALVHASFVWRFQKAPAPPIDVTIESTFILIVQPGAPKIVFQLEHEDFQQALRASGVLPPSS